MQVRALLKDRFAGKNGHDKHHSPAERKTVARARETKRLPDPIKVRNITWRSRCGNPHILVNQDALLEVLRGLMRHRPAIYQPLYRRMVSCLEAAKPDSTKPFRIYFIADGADERRKSLGEFVAVMVPKVSAHFALPGTLDRVRNDLASASIPPI